MPVDIKKNEKCIKCGGKGWNQLTYLNQKITCDRCGGTGEKNGK